MELECIVIPAMKGLFWEQLKVSSHCRWPVVAGIIILVKIIEKEIPEKSNCDLIPLL